MDGEDLQPYVDIVLDLLAPLLRAIEDRDEAANLLRVVGYNVQGPVVAFESFGAAVDSLLEVIATLDTAVETGNLDDAAPVLAKLVVAVGRIIAGVNTFDSQIQSNFAGSLLLTQTDILAQIVRKLADYLIVSWLGRRHPLVNALLQLGGVIAAEDVRDTPTAYHAPYRKYVVNWDVFPGLLSQPIDTLRSSVLAGNEFQFGYFIVLLDELASSFGLPSYFRTPDADSLQKLNDGRDISTHDDFDQLATLRFPLIRDPNAGLYFEVYPRRDLATKRFTGAGIGLRFGSQTEIPLTADYVLKLTIGANLEDSLGLIWDVSSGFSFVNKLFTPNPQTFADSVQFGVKAAIGRGPDAATDPLISIGTSSGSRFLIGSGTLALGVEKLTKLRVFAEGNLKDGALVLKSDEADGFLATLLPADGLTTSFGFGLGVANDVGLYFIGASGLEIRLPVHVELGPLQIDYLSLGARFEAGTVPFTVAAGFSAMLGPLTAAVEDMGLKATFAFKSDRSGNLGPLDVALGFKPPKGVGLALDAGAVKGGGYLYLDTDRGEYTGALELVVADWLQLTAIGLITTKMPDGSKGFSLLVIVTADFGTGIQLGFGFTLMGVGGLLGLNRTMLFQPLLDGVRTGAINGILFPTDVVANAPKIISDLRAIFPPKNDTFLIGPMAKLGWGTPTLLSASLGVIIEIPPADIAILGIIKLALPEEDEVILLLQVNFAGALEFDKKRLYFFASLYDSRILFITIQGEMGLLVAYGSDANLVLSVGGFHPQFNPPPLPFPSPKRVQLDIINESHARVRCDGYFAVTSNTAQFGAHAEYFFGFSAVSVTGHSGFDALFQFSPFHFIIAGSTAFSANVFGIGVYSLNINLTLSGPTPWHAHGTASISFLFFSIGIGIDITWGDRRDTSLPPIAVMPILVAELGKSANWRAQLPSGSNLLVSLRQLDPADTTLVLHPVGTLRVSQRAVPLDLTLDKDGNQTPSDANRFHLDVSAGGLARTQDLNEPFAPAQFRNFSDADKLSQAAYTPQHSGVELAASGSSYATGTAITRNVRYELTVIDTQYRQYLKRFFLYINSLFLHFLGGASVARNAFSAATLNQMQPWARKVTVSGEIFAVANLVDNRAYSADSAGFSSRVSAQDYLNRTLAAQPSLTGTLHVLGQHELMP